MLSKAIEVRRSAEFTSYTYVRYQRNIRLSSVGFTGRARHQIKFVRNKDRKYLKHLPFASVLMLSY